MRLWPKSIFSSRDLDGSRVRALCAQVGCHNRLPARFVPGSRAGIFVGEQWYCSAECFSHAAHGILASLSAAEVVEVPRTPRLSLGLALLTKGSLTTEQFQQAMAQHELDGVDLEATVTRLGWVTDKQLAAARAAQWGYPVLGQDLSSHSVIADLPSILFRACSATPLYYSDETKRLVLGFVQRVDHSLLQSIEQITGCRAEPCFITPAELTRQLGRMTEPPRYEQAMFEWPGAVSQMARTVGDYAAQAAASQAIFTRCHSFLWARLAGNRETRDVLFDLKNAEAASSPGHSAEVAEIAAGNRDRAFAKRAGRSR